MHFIHLNSFVKFLMSIPIRSIEHVGNKLYEYNNSSN